MITTTMITGTPIRITTPKSAVPLPFRGDQPLQPISATIR